MWFPVYSLNYFPIAAIFITTVTITITIIMTSPTITTIIPSPPLAASPQKTIEQKSRQRKEI